MDPASPNPYPPAGTVIDNKYRIERMLGEGGMGAVAEATHLLFHTSVALKFMNPQFMLFPGAVERFLNEGKASATIQSEHVVRVTDGGKLSTGAPYLVMDFMDGCDLADLLVKQGKPGLPVERTVHFVVQVLRGLQVAHATGIIHRDMKPSNCFVVKHEGEADFVKILDFGISKVTSPGGASLTQTNSALGTPLYMSPEQAKSPRDVDARSDLYSTGVILYELLTGETPFTSKTGELMEILFQLFTAEVPHIKTKAPQLSDEFAAVVHKALAREPDNRFGSALEMAQALAPFGTEHTRSLVARMNNFVATRRSVRPAGPASMVAFSALTAQGSRMPTPPPAEPVTQMRVQPASHAAAEHELGSHVATAHTQMSLDSERPQPIGAPVHVRASEPPPHPVSHAPTPMHAVRDTTASDLAPPPPTPKGLLIGIGLVVLLIVGAAGTGVVIGVKRYTAGAPIPSAVALPPPPPEASSVAVATSASAPPSAPPSASASGAPVASSPSASASVVVPKRPPPQPSPPPGVYDPNSMKAVH